MFRFFRRIGSSPSRPLSERRRGAMTVLIAAMLTIFVVGLCFSVDIAYMQLTRTQLQVATDAAAKAAVVNLAQGGTSTAAKNAAVAAAALNKVDGKGLTINSSNVTLGSLTPGVGGAWTFSAGTTPYMAAQVGVNMTPGSTSGAVNMFFAPILGTNTFSPQNTSTAGFVQNVVCLVLDRSGSMCWDLSGTDWSYPPGVPAFPHAYVIPPNSPQSRWSTLGSAVSLYLNVLSQSANPPPVGLVTWASDISAGSLSGYHYPSFNATTTNAAIAYNNNSTITNAISNLGSNIMVGGTDMQSGMQAGATLLQNYTPNLPCNRVMILMTDGQWNVGSDPAAYASTLAAANIKVHTVGLLIGSMQATLQQISTTTGGLNFMATDSASLNAAFTALAKDLAVILTQ